MQKNITKIFAILYYICDNKERAINIKYIEIVAINNNKNNQSN